MTWPVSGTPNSLPYLSWITSLPPLSMLSNNEFSCSHFRPLTVNSFCLHPFDSLRTFYANLLEYTNKRIKKKWNCLNNILFHHDGMADSSEIILIKYYPHHCCTFLILFFFIEDTIKLNRFKLQTSFKLCHSYWDAYLWDDNPRCLSDLQIPYQNNS